MFSYPTVRRWLLQLASLGHSRVRHDAVMSRKQHHALDGETLLIEGGRDYVTIATYDKTTEAHIAKGRLAAEGISALLFDDNMVQMDWLYAIALGGIKLRVKTADETRARNILATDYSQELDGVDLGKPDP
ncbi:MAG: DUF2007 domain-containing protein [Gammaproteobacteria bacterium]|nr:DUF2007 domain-containing protein [Gammaproteobacteria bacterium]MDE2345004.1 DUF2007 domain-containing protein [Gammaproteobacteria bacterium]